jgi:hypothetical protein
MLFKNRLPNLVRRFLSPVLAMVGCLLVAATATAGPLGDVFVIDMENHNLTQPGSVTSPAQLQGNAAAPYLNSLMTPGNPNAAQTSWASNYYNVAAGVHPSLPNYLWQEAGTNFGVTNDNEPFGTGGANQGKAMQPTSAGCSNAQASPGSLTRKTSISTPRTRSWRVASGQCL